MLAKIIFLLLVCETVTTAVFDPGCGKGWEYDSTTGNCYLFKPNSYKCWTDAETECNKGGGNLVSISSPEEMSYINSRLGLITEGSLWIGATDASNEGVWMWTDNSTFEYLNWASGEPNNAGVGGEQCALIYVGTGMWNDEGCNDELGYICKKNAMPTPNCDGYQEGDSWEPRPCEFCSCVSGNKICLSPACHVPCANSVPGEGACCPTCPDRTPTPPPDSPDCDGYTEGDSWEPRPCEFCSCVSGSKECVIADCFVPCFNPIPVEGACCPTCPDVTPCKKIKKCRPRSFWNKEKCKCECYHVECLPGYKFNTKKCRCQCQKKRCLPGFYFDRKCCQCKCRRFLECEPGQVFSQETCGCPFVHDECNGLYPYVHYSPRPCEYCICEYAWRTCYTPCSAVKCADQILEEGPCCHTCPDETPTEPDCYEEDYLDIGSCEKCRCKSGQRICTSRAAPCPPIRCADPLPEKGSCCPICPHEIQATPPAACEGLREGDFWLGHHNCGICTCKSGRRVCSSSSRDGAIPCATAISVEGISCPDGINCDPDRCPHGYEFNSTECICQCKKRECSGTFIFNPRCCRCECNLNHECPGIYTLNHLTCSCEHCPPKYCGIGRYFKQEECRCRTCDESWRRWCGLGGYRSISDGYTCKCVTYEEEQAIRMEHGH